MYCIYSYIQWNLSITFGAMQPGILMYEGSNYWGGGENRGMLGESHGGLAEKRTGAEVKPTWEGIVLDA